MAQIEQRGYLLAVEISSAVIDFFKEHRIRFEHQVATHRFDVGKKVLFDKQLRLHSNTLHLVGNHMMMIESFSYAFSELNPRTRIGRYCSIAWNVRIMGPQHNMNSTTSSEILYRPDGFFSDTFAQFDVGAWQFLPNPQPGHIEIGHDVWIGQDVLIKPGVKIGTGSVVAAGSVVTKDIEPYEIVGGVPAKRIRSRFPADLVTDLLRSEWWKYAIPQMPHLSWGSPRQLVQQLNTEIGAGTAKSFDSDLGLAAEVFPRL